ncbi:MAG TPA: glycine betaine ABC transporter substrate-binding protein [Chloroflexia bacterium]|nr:glycine betaine ABC transporter substrate-binding protein [Chloroflexia bacterium]
MNTKHGAALAALLLIAGLLLPACGDTPAPTTISGAGTNPDAAVTAAPAATPAGGTADATPGGPGGLKAKVVVSSKDFTEELLVGEMYALMLEQAGIPVSRKLNLGGVQIAQAALLKGDISLYPEYTGTGLLNVLNYTGPTMNDDQAVYDKVKKDYEEQFKLTWLDQAPMNDTQALATTHAVAGKYGLKTLSDLSAKAGELRLASIAEFQDRPDGLPGLKKTYGGFDFKQVAIFDIGLKYKALLQGDAEVAVAFSTDGAIAGNDLVVLQDDKHLWPPYHVAPVVRDDVLANYPQIKDVLNTLSPKLTSEAVSALNWEVDGKKRDYVEVAKEFLVKQGLLKTASSQ